MREIKNKKKYKEKVFAALDNIDVLDAISLEKSKTTTKMSLFK